MSLIYIMYWNLRGILNVITFMLILNSMELSYLVEAIFSIKESDLKEIS